MTAIRSETVSAPRILECPVQMEAVLEDKHGLAETDEIERGKILTMELPISKTIVFSLSPVLP
jgi:hypothetical protein